MMFRKKIGLLVLSAALAFSTFLWGPGEAMAATSYYVATTGSDSNPGTQASPFRTIQKAASVAAAGDTVIIRGGTYRETVTPANSGTAGSPITYQAYPGETVTVSGADAVTSGWSVHAGSVYKTSVALGLGAENQVFVNGEMMVEARWPNIASQDAAMSHPQFATADSASLTSVSDSNLTPSAGFYTGARIWVEESHHWVAQTSAITSSSVGSVTFNAVSGEATPGEGSRYYIYGKLNLLDAAKEWFYAGGTLYLQPPGGGSPTNVEYKARTYAFDLANRSYIQIAGLKLFASTIRMSNSSHNILDGIDARYVSHTNAPGYAWGDDTTGILIHGNDNTLKNSKIAYSSGNCIVVSGSGNRIVNNEVHECDYNGTDDAGIYISSFYSAPNTLIAYNTVYNTGRGAILPKTTQGVRIAYNDLSQFSKLMDDAGAIYVFRTDGMGSEIDHNYIHDGGEGLVSGIYLDNGSSNYWVHHNVIANVAIGMILNPPNHFSLIYNNTLYGTTGLLGGDDYYGGQIYNNILQAAAPSKFAVWGNNLHADVSDLQFVNAAAGDFRIQSGSRAIDAGQAFAGITDGYAGSAPDIGAYEYGGTDWTAGRNFATPPNPGFSLSDASYRNHLANGDFENGLASWTKTDAQSATTEDSSVQAGWKNVRLGTSTDGIQQVVTGLSPNTTYTLSGWGNVSAAGMTVRLGVQSYGGSDQYVTFNTTSRTNKSLTFTTGSSHTSATVYFYRPSGGSAYAYGDSFGLTLVPPSPAPLFVEPTESDYSANLLTNPGFESDLAGWPTDWSNTAISTAAGTVHGGSKAMRMGTGTAGRVQNVTSGVTAGEVYRLGGWAKVADVSNAVFMGLGFLDGSGDLIAEYKMNFHSTDYEYKEMLVQAPAGTASINVYPFILGATGYAYVDDLKLNRVELSDGGGTGTPTVYEAEDGTYGNGGREQNASQASNGKVVGNLNAEGAYSQISGVDGGSGGSATVNIRYSNGYTGNRSLSLYVNGVDVQQVIFVPTGGWNAFTETGPIAITLNAGTGNTIKLQRDSGDAYAADIDKYTVTPSGSGSSAPSLLTGTAFGTSGTWSPPGDTYDKVFDGNTSTFFDSTTATGAYAGIDLGAGNAKKITQIKFYPRASQLGRMVGGKFQGSNTSSSSGYTDLYTVTTQPALNWVTIPITDNTTYRYLRYIGGTNSYGNVAEVEFWGE